MKDNHHPDFFACHPINESYLQGAGATWIRQPLATEVFILCENLMISKEVFIVMLFKREKELKQIIEPLIQEVKTRLGRVE